MNLKLLQYRRCVGIVVFNHNGLILSGKRIEKGPAKSECNNGIWQMPQGGIEAGESYLDAAVRELEEETGISANNIKVIQKLDKWVYYDIPREMIPKNWSRRRYKGQKQRWFLIRFTGDDSEINVKTKHQEFSDWKWTNVESIKNEIVYFKKEAYKEVMEFFEPIIASNVSVERDKKQ